MCCKIDRRKTHMPDCESRTQRKYNRDMANDKPRLPISLILAVVIPFAVIMIFVLKLAIRARRAKVTTGTAGMIGLVGRAQTAIAPQGTVFVRGELWRARSQMNIAGGEGVRVKGINGLTLDVEAEKEPAGIPKTASAVDEQPRDYVEEPNSN